MADTYHFSAPGRTEIGGNHTDHQHGCVLAAAVDMETTAEVTLTGTNIIRVDSEGYKPVEIDLNDLDAKRVREEHHGGADPRRGGGVCPAGVQARAALTPRSGLPCCPAPACPARRRLRC